MNAQIYKHTDYRKAFALLFQERRKSHPGWSTAQLAERILVQPSHITNVVKERGHFSSDQIFAICEELELSSEETHYLDLLMEAERAQHPLRRKQLQESVQKIRDQKLRADKELKAKQPSLTPQQNEGYYLDPNIELIHMYLGTKEASSDTSEIARLWGIDSDYVSRILSFLQGAGLIEQRRGRWHARPVHQLLPSSSPLCKPQQMLKRLRAMDAIQKLSSDRIYSFQGTLTMSEETRLQIQARFVEFLKEVEALVLESPEEGLYHLQFDLFPWINIKTPRR